MRVHYSLVPEDNTSERARECLKLSGSGDDDSAVYRCPICELPGLLAKQCGNDRQSVHDIFFGQPGRSRRENDGDMRGVLRDIREGLQTSSERNTDNGVIAFHEQDGWSHVHVVHGCATYRQTQSCRCHQYRRLVERLGRFGHKRQYRGASTEEDWRRLFFYLHKQGRQVEEVKCGDSSYERAGVVEGDAQRDKLRCRADVHESYKCAVRVCDASSCSTLTESRKRPKKSTESKGREKKSKSQRGRSDTELGQEIQAKFLKWMPLSAQNFINNEKFIWNFPELKYDEKRRDKLVQAAMRYVKLDYNRMTGAELCTTLHERPWVLLQDGHCSYYDPEFSYQILIRLLFEQMRSEEEVAYFLEGVKAIVDKKHEKKNTLCIISPPSAGKSFIVNSLASVLLNVGHILTSSKHSPNRFAFQDAHNCRVAIWNEASFCSEEQVQKAKEVLEGNATNIEKKFASNILMERTPIIITANAKPWRAYLHEEQAFLDRMYFFNRWSPQPWLKQLKLKLNPLAWYYVFCANQQQHWDTFPTKQELINTQDDHTFLKFLKTHYPHKL